MSNRVNCRWSETELKFLKDNVDVLSYKELSTLLGRSYGAVGAKAVELGCITRTVGRKNKRKVNDIRVLDDYCILTYTDKRNNVFECKFDKSDLDLVRQYYWDVQTSRGVYVRTTITSEKHRQKVITMHRLLMGFPTGNVVDHINGDSLDNRRSNLRVVGSNINSYNKYKSSSSTGIRGLYINTYKGNLSYIATVKRNNKILFYKRYPYNAVGLATATQDLIEANNFINRNNCLYDSSISCKSEIRDYILKREQLFVGSENRLYGYRKFCQYIKEKDNFICCGCGVNFSDTPSKLQIHHILPRCDFPDKVMDEFNCISVCAECHASIKNREYEIAGLLHRIVKTR